MKHLIVRMGMATGAAVAVNLTLYALGAALGASYVVPDDLAGEKTTTLGWVEIVLGTVMPMAIGTLLWLALRRRQRGFVLLSALSGVTVVLSLVPFAGDWGLASKVFLGLMHFTTPIVFLAATRPSKEPAATHLGAEARKERHAV